MFFIAIFVKGPLICVNRAVFPALAYDRFPTLNPTNLTLVLNSIFSSTNVPDGTPIGAPISIALSTKNQKKQLFLNV